MAATDATRNLFQTSFDSTKSPDDVGALFADDAKVFMISKQGGKELFVDYIKLFPAAMPNIKFDLAICRATDDSPQEVVAVGEFWGVHDGADLLDKSPEQPPLNTNCPFSAIVVFDDNNKVKELYFSGSFMFVYAQLNVVVSTFAPRVDKDLSSRDIKQVEVDESTPEQRAKNKSVVDENIKLAIAGNIDDRVGLYHENALCHEPTKDNALDAIKARFQQSATLKNLEITPKKIVTAGSLVANYSQTVCDNVGKQYGMSTIDKCDVNCLTVWKFDQDGKIVEEWEHNDRVTYMETVTESKYGEKKEKIEYNLDWPINYEEITNEYLTRVLVNGFSGLFEREVSEQQKNNDNKVVSFESKGVGEVHGYAGCSVLVTDIKYEKQDETLPTSVFCKFALPENNSTRKMLSGLRIYEREILMYTKYLKESPCDVPPIYAAHYHEPTGDFMLVMKDMRDKHQVGDQLQGCSFERSKKVLTILGNYHGHWWNDERLSTDEFKLFGSTFLSKMGDGFATAKPVLIDQLGDKATDEVKQNIEQLGKYTTALQEIAAAKTTLAHGDFRLDNMLFRKDDCTDDVPEVVLIDWQIVHYGSHYYDLINWMISNMGAELLRDHGKELYDVYAAAVESTAKGKITKEEISSQYHVFLCWGVVFGTVQMSQMALGMKQGSTMEGRIEKMLNVMIERLTSLVDLLPTILPCLEQFDTNDKYEAATKAQ